jgi:predicted dithiol-disulfide oxidoreductase (DUF899 family)
MSQTGTSTETQTIAMPPIVSREEWQALRDELMVKEKEHTRAKDALSAERRRLPMVEIDKDYRFTDLEGNEVTLVDLFEGRRQLIVQHFMFHPDWDKGCPSCTFSVNQIANLDALDENDVTYALVARAPIEKLATYREAQGWQWPWYSSGETSFNRDFGVTVEEDMEIPGYTMFVRDGDAVYQTYNTGGRGCEPFLPVLGFLDTTVYGRQQDFEDSPPGWPQRPT